MAVMAVAVSACAAVRSPNPDPAAPTPGRSTSPTDAPGSRTEAGPTADPREPGTQPRRQPKISPDAPPLGMDVRYVDDDGNFKVLRVKDFRR